jgi:hypothetical protein
MPQRRKCEWCAGSDYPTVEQKCGHVLCTACSRGVCPCCVDEHQQPRAADGVVDQQQSGPALGADGADPR